MLAFTIGAYRLVDFIHLGIRQLKKLSPDSPILVSDDASPESGHIKAISEGLGAQYRCSRIRKGHFSADMQSFVNALAFAEAMGADVAVKVSQRFIFRQPESIAAITEAFADPNIVFATPGQPKVAGSFGRAPTNSFGAFTVLSDIMAIRVGCLSPSDLIHKYRSRLLTEKVPWGSFVECMADDLHRNVLTGRTVKMEALTNQPDIEDSIYLRRYQNTEQQYAALAGTHGFGGRFPTTEWSVLDGRNYLCKPLVV